ncbi:MAG TPA: hypothetical protein VH112_08220 [Acidimicrobiales bacterium]|nr:hypothetical protein [Acidimicrobiales bacterium]
MTAALRLRWRGPRLPAWPPTRSTLLTLAAVLTLAVPFAVIIVRFLADTRHVYLPDDLALIDLHVRDAIHWHQQLGPFDRFGWSHPGAAYFYLLSIPARVLGAGARADFVGATLINALSALSVVWIVRRRSGPVAALWAALCLGLLAFVLASTNPGAITFSEGPLGALVSPWNPDVVIFPLVLFGVLCAAGASGSVLSLLGAALLGSFVIQTNFATLGLVVVLLGLALVAAVVRNLRARRSSPGPGPLWRSVPAPWVLVAGLALLVLIWVPPVLQQLGNHPGNLTLIWRFFTAHHTPLSFGVGLWSVVTVDGILAFGVPTEMTPFELGDPRHHAAVVLAVVLSLGVAAIAVGLRRRRQLGADLGVVSLIGLVVAVFSVTRIVGLVFGYLVIWEIAVPVLGLIGLGVAVLGTSHAPAPAEAPQQAGWWRRLPAATLVALAGLVTAALSLEMVHLPSLQRASDPDVAAAWKEVGAHLRPGDKPVFVGDQGTPLLGVFTFFGLINELDARGYEPRVNAFWPNQVGTIRLSKGGEPVGIVLYPPSPSVESMPGYIGHTTYADIVLTRPAPSS